MQCLQETYFRFKGTDKKSEKVGKHAMQTNSNHELAVVTMLTLDKLTLKPKKVTRDKDGIL